MEGPKQKLWLKLCGWLIMPAIVLSWWQWYAAALQSPWILPTPVAVFKTLLQPCVEHYAAGSLLGGTLISMLRVSCGFIIAACAGITLGLLLGSVRTLYYLLEPLIELVRPLCPIAWLPFTIAVFGLKTLPNLFGFDYTKTVFDQVYLGMIFVLFWGGFFPIFINTLDGVSGVKKNYQLLAKSLGASTWQLFLKVNLPAALPMVITGMRQGLALCWFVIIAAEMLPGSDSGIGYLLMEAANQSDMAIVVAAMIIIGSVGAAINLGMVAIMKVFVKWHGKEV